MRHAHRALPLLAAVVAGCVRASTVAAPAPLDAGPPAAHVPAEGIAGALLAAGGGRPGSGYVGAGVQGLFPSGSALSSGLGFDLNYTANVAERFSVELSLGRVGYDMAPGSLDAVTLGATAQFGTQFAAARWYAGGGAAWWMNDASGAPAEVDDSLVWVVAAGADLPVAANGNLCIELRYVLGEADLSGGGALDLDAFGVRANYVFKY